MISDVLFQAVNDIRGYLEEPFNYHEDEAFMRRIEAVLGEMDAIRAELDTIPYVLADFIRDHTNHAMTTGVTESGEPYLTCMPCGDRHSTAH